MTLQQTRAEEARQHQLTAQRIRQIDGCVWSDGNRVVNTRPDVDTRRQVRCILAILR